MFFGTLAIFTAHLLVISLVPQQNDMSTKTFEGTHPVKCVLQVGYWELSTELGKCVNVDLDIFAGFLESKGILSLGEIHFLPGVVLNIICYQYCFYIVDCDVLNNNPQEGCLGLYLPLEIGIFF